MTLLCLTLVALPGCYYDTEEELYPNSFCDTTNLTYSAKINSVIQSNCATPGCHVAGGTGTGDYTNYTEVRAAVDNGTFLQSIRRDANGIPMPPSGSLRSCELQQLEQWVAAGAQNN